MGAEQFDRRIIRPPPLLNECSGPFHPNVLLPIIDTWFLIAPNCPQLRLLISNFLLAYQVIYMKTFSSSSRFLFVL